MRITGVKIFESKSVSSNNIPEAEIQLDGIIALRGIHIHHSRFGYFLTFPGKGSKNFVDFMQPAFAKTLRQSVLKAFREWRFPMNPEASQTKGMARYARSNT